MLPCSWASYPWHFKCRGSFASYIKQSSWTAWPCTAFLWTWRHYDPSKGLKLLAHRHGVTLKNISVLENAIVKNLKTCIVRLTAW